MAAAESPRRGGDDENDDDDDDNDDDDENDDDDDDDDRTGAADGTREFRGATKGLMARSGLKAPAADKSLGEMGESGDGECSSESGDR